MLILTFNVGASTLRQTAQPAINKTLDRAKHIRDFQVIEFRRYTVKEGEREHFAEYFESYFPEAFQQMGAIAFGQFFERQNPVGFTWLRGFKNIDARAVVNAGFYYGPLWREHAFTMNSLMVDSNNVLLLRPLSPERGVTVLPSVDPVAERKGAQGVLVAQIFAVKTTRRWRPNLLRWRNGPHNRFRLRACSEGRQNW